MKSDAIIGAVQGVTKKWAKQRKAEERRASAEANRYYVMTRSYRYTIKDAAWDVMEAAYLKASSDGRLPAHARQIMYAARGEIQNKTGERLDDQYFTQTLLPDYMAEHPEETASWNVVYDARGHLLEPHTDKTVALGTLAVRKYLGDLRQPSISLVGIEPAKISTHGPEGRYGAILFVEKEGFMPLFEAVKLAERYDIAIMSTKGMSNTASRELVERLCLKHDLPLLVLHDFDKAGFSIVGTLHQSTRRYTFQYRMREKVVDLGLRLADIEKYGLDYEDVHYRGHPYTIKRNLRKNGATEEEAEILVDQRVELNALTSGDLVEWIEGKLEEQGIQKVVPDDDLLERSYRHAIEVRYFEQRVEGILEEAAQHAEDIGLPDDLQDEVRERLGSTPALSWDDAVLAIATDNSDEEDET